MLKEETLNEVERRGYEEPKGDFLEMIDKGTNTITVLTRVEREKVAAPFEPEGYTVKSLTEELDVVDPTIEELELLVEAEQNGKNRATAIDAIKNYQ